MTEAINGTLQREWGGMTKAGGDRDYSEEGFYLFKKAKGRIFTNRE
jgi:hypothetical protein